MDDRIDVRFLRWPAESDRRDEYYALGRLRILVVEAGARPPISADVREDWVRPPVTQEDVNSRILALRARSGVDCKPHVDPHGVIHYGGRSCTLSPTATDLLERLSRDFGELVRRHELLDCLPERNEPATRNALDLHMMRARKRIRPLGLIIRTVWGQGYLLEQETGVSENLERSAPMSINSDSAALHLTNGHRPEHNL